MKNAVKLKMLVLTCIFILSTLSNCHDSKSPWQGTQITAYQSCRPYTRWWWHASVFTENDLRNQLIWLKEQGFGGVEIAFIYPVNRNPHAERFEWLGEQWQQMVVFAKQCADSLGIGCDFTFGTLWPFGGTFVKDEDRTKVWGDSSFKQPLRLSWTHPDTGNVIDHLNRKAFEKYARVMGYALKPAMYGSQSAIFCDSWEVETRNIWTDGFEKIFFSRYGYDITVFMDSIYYPDFAGPRYDYMKLVSELVLENFYKPFTQKAHELGGISRAQCAGAPVDIIQAYASIDVPETEAMLYEPNYSRIVASAAALAGKNIVSSESFTCLYGWPDKFMFKEQTADLKLIADALFANGVNQHIWHGTPFNPIGSDSIAFYATVHVGRKGNLAEELIPFNEYLTRVSCKMRTGWPFSEVAIYLPLEDRWIEGEMPEELQFPWAWGAYEMRYEYIPEELKGFNPLWINTGFLKQAKVENNQLKIGKLQFKILYVYSKYLDLETLTTIESLARKGLPVCMPTIPEQAGFKKDPKFTSILKSLSELQNFYTDWNLTGMDTPLVSGSNLPEFWVRTDGKMIRIFFANPLAKRLKYPLQYGQSFQEKNITTSVIINFHQHRIPVDLVFEPYQSILITITDKGNLEFEDIHFVPRTPSINP